LYAGGEGYENKNSGGGREERFMVDRTGAESADLYINLSGLEENPLRESYDISGSA
jgi:hypothetical protein